MSLYCASMLEEGGSIAMASRMKDAMAPLHHALADPRGPTLWRVQRCVRRGQELSRFSTVSGDRSTRRATAPVGSCEYAWIRVS